MSEDMVSPFNEADMRQRLNDTHFEKLQFYSDKSHFVSQDLKIRMVSGNVYLTKQHLNKLAIKKPLIQVMIEQGFINVGENSQLNALCIESVDVLDNQDSQKTHISSKGIAYLIDSGYTSDGIILSKNMLEKALDYEKQHTLFEDDDN